jgi:hypothetical protein
MNWIDKRASRDKNIEGASELWQRAASAIDNPCTSFKNHYSHVGEISCSPENGHRVLVVEAYGWREIQVCNDCF